MRVLDTNIPEVKILVPKVFGDQRGFFFESYNQTIVNQAISNTETFVQDNHSRSAKNVLRGLHYQLRNPQGKLVRVTQGTVFDVAVDIRRSSPTFGQWTSTILSEENKHLFWVPAGFAHGFVVLSETADFLYKTTNFYDPTSERTIIWNDPDIAITWPKEITPILSTKDKAGITLKSAEVFP